MMGIVLLSSQAVVANNNVVYLGQTKAKVQHCILQVRVVASGGYSYI